MSNLPEVGAWIIVVVDIEAFCHFCSEHPKGNSGGGELKNRENW